MGRVGRLAPDGGKLVATVGVVIWTDDGKPWAVLTVEAVGYNVDVRAHVRARGE